MAMVVAYKTIATNRRARHDIEVKERLMAGIALAGHEVKSVRNGHVQLKGTYADFIQNELWLINAHISPYPKAKVADYEPGRSRKLLLHRQQLNKLIGAKQSGQVIAVLGIGLVGNLIKVELGVGRGRKAHDKRQHIKRRQADLEAAKAMSSRRGTVKK
jgi:SsrA-binding protein